MRVDTEVEQQAVGVEGVQVAAVGFALGLPQAVAEVNLSERERKKNVLRQHGCVCGMAGAGVASGRQQEKREGERFFHNVYE